MNTMSADERICYVHCSFCSTILAVSVPGNSLLNMVTVRCGHCLNLLSVNMGALLPSLPFQDVQNHNPSTEGASSSKDDSTSVMSSQEINQKRAVSVHPPEKRQRVPSAYNRFIKEEIQRIKAGNPDISHREAFSAAAKNWAYLPHINFMDGHDSAKIDEVFASDGIQKTQGLC